MKSFTTIVYSFLLCIIAQSTNAQATIIPSGSSWKFLTTVLIKETGRESFDDATWASGNAQWDMVMVMKRQLLVLALKKNKYITTYFRKPLK
jgi:hypothetical protein